MWSKQLKNLSTVLWEYKEGVTPLRVSGKGSNAWVSCKVGACQEDLENRNDKGKVK